MGGESFAAGSSSSGERNAGFGMKYSLEADLKIDVPLWVMSAALRREKGPHSGYCGR